MKFEEYLQTVVHKIGPNSAFDLSRDARIKALEKILIEKEIATQEEIDAALEKELGETAQTINKMPPLPTPHVDTSNKKNKPTEIRTSLPYCLYRIDTRFFSLKDKNNTRIRFTKIETAPNRRASASQNMESIRDRWGIDAHSDVQIYTDKKFSDMDGAQNFSLKTINKFIRTYRYFDRDAVHLVTLTREDLFGFDFLQDGKGQVSIALGGGIRTSLPLLTHEISNRVEELILNNKEISLWEDLLLNAEQYIFQAEFRHSILESVIALELVVSKIILKFYAEKGISEKDANEHIQAVGITGGIKVTLKLLLPVGDFPDDDIFEKCKAGITLRNNIVHRGAREATEINAKETFDNTKKLIVFLTPYL